MFGLSLAMTILLIIAITLGLYMAWNIGANDVANSMATAVGAKAITPLQAVFIAGVLEAAGAILVGSHVADTVKKDIVDTTGFDVNVIIAGFLAAILASCLWITLATWRGLPVSTTHSIIGALVGFGMVAKGGSVIEWFTLVKVVMSWILSPLVGAIIAYIVFRLIVKFIFNRNDPERAAHISSPIVLYLTFFIILASLLMKTPFGKQFLGIGKEEILYPLFLAAIFAVVPAFLGYFIIVRPVLKKIKKKNGDYSKVEAIFRRLQIITSCYVAFAHGANDVANAIGPVAGVIQAILEGTIGTKAEVPIWLLVIGGLGIAIGVFTWGYRVMKTVGFKITKLTNTRGFSVDFAAATTVLLASKLGMPVSTTHTVVGAVIGVGLARGISAIDFRVVGKIFLSWVITVPIAGITTAVIFIIAKFVFL